MNPVERPIKVFDSGIGGLTVLRALRAQLPHEAFVYLGDTARLPYGTKTAATVERYALQATALLAARRDIKCLVIACNTASAAALPAIQSRFAALPVVGVIEPGAASACAATRNGRVAVIATEGVRGRAYQQAIARLRPDITVTAIATRALRRAGRGDLDDGRSGRRSRDAISRPLSIWPCRSGRT